MTRATRRRRERQKTEDQSTETGDPSAVLARADASLLDLVDHVLTKGVVLNGDLVLGVAQIDLVYLRLSAVLCAADRVLGRRASARSRRRASREDRR